jgi:tetratricopeptide (TPR) repeat protein
MQQATEQFRRAVEFHAGGQLARARDGYEEVLRLEPRHAAALHYLGVLTVQCGNATLGMALIAQAIGLEPNDASMHFHMGNAFRALRQLDAARASYTRAVELNPNFAQAYGNRGIVLCELSRPQEALADYDKAISIKSDFAEIWSNRGDLLRELGRLDEALESCDTAVGLRTDLADAHCNRAVVLRALKRWDEALVSLDHTVAIDPEHAVAHHNRGLVLKDLEQWEAALGSYERAIAIDRRYAEAYRSRGILLLALKRPREALASIDEAISIDPYFAEAYSSRGTVLHRSRQFAPALQDFDQAIALKAHLPEAHFNRGSVLHAMRNFDAAIASYDEAIALNPTDPAAHLNRALARLSLGDYARGWKEYEWRWEELSSATRGKEGRRVLPQPLWLGEASLAGKTILLHSEQGLGDTIQFCRYVELVGRLGAKVILEVPAALASLMRCLPHVAQVIGTGEAPPPFDYHCPLLSLPLAFNTELETVPAEVPYLRPDPEKVLYWKEKLGDKHRLRVGLVWSGGLRPDQPDVWEANMRRNIPLALLEPLANPDVEFVSLQKGQPAAELTLLISNGWAGPRLTDFASLLLDFSDTAALIDNLDLVISVDTSTAHLAGALAKPVWILNRHDSCWRWLLGRVDSPWYPTVRLYQQRQAGDWNEVIQNIQSDLMKLAGTIKSDQRRI